jgi:hypothetical protein
VHGEHEQELLEVHRLSAVVRICPTLFSPPELSQEKSSNATPRKERLGGRKGDSHYGCVNLQGGRVGVEPIDL